MISRVSFLILFLCTVQFSFSQSDDDDYYLGHGFASGDTLYTNSGTFWDAGGIGEYGQDEDWEITFCSNNGNPLTFDFSNFATDYRGGMPPAPGEFQAYDYLLLYIGTDTFRAYHNDTPQFAFTAPGGCVGFRFRSQPASELENGWDAEISANPPPANNDPCTAAILTVGNVCAPSVFNNKGAFGTGIGSPACHTFLGGDVWFTAQVPVSGELKIESFAGTLDWAVMVLYDGSDCNNLTELTCDETTSAMPTRILTGRSPGETIYIRIFGDQAKSGTFGICASDPSTPIEGFTGPGGVGDETENDLWLRADRGVLTSGGIEAIPGESIQTWTDHSGNDNHVTQATAGNQPTLTGNAINGQPVLGFNAGASQYLTGEMGPIAAPVTMIAVSRFTTSATDAYVMTVGDLNAIQTASISREADNDYYTFTQGTKHYGPSMADNAPYIIHARHNIGATFHEIFLNETSFGASDYGSALSTDGSLIIGASRNIDSYLGGDIAEAIVYNKILNTAQKIIVENYLAAKFGINIPTDRFAFEANHGFDVAGIGQVDDGNRHTDAQSAGILAVGNPTDLEDGEFLLFGHDNGDTTSWISTDLPDNDVNLLRIEREWRVNSTGGDGMGLVTVSLLDTLVPVFPPEFLSLILWVDEDGDFTNGAVPYPVIRVGNQYIANAVDLQDSLYMTIGCVRPVAGFTLPASAGLESIPNPQIEVSLNYGLSVELSVQYRAIDGTATGGGVDYLLNPDVLTFLPGSKTAYIVPLIIDNELAEPDKNFEIRISSPSTGLILNADTIHTYTILNDDIAVTAITDTDSIGACYPVVANLGANVVGTGPYTYSWTPTDSLSDPSLANPVADPTASNWYVVNVTDLTNGAEGIDSVFITVLTGPSKPIITTGGPTTFCSGDSVQLGSSPETSYLWSTGETTRDIQAKTSGSYTLRVFDDLGCTSEVSDPVLVTANPLPGQPLITASGSTTFCDGDSVDLGSSDAFSYLWSNSDTTQTIRVKINGDFFIRVSDTNGCQSIPSETTTVTVYSLPPTPTITADGSTDICEHDSVRLTSSPGTGGYLWSTGDSTQSIYAKTVEDYTVQTINTAGCLSIPSDIVPVTTRPAPLQPIISYTGNTTFCEGYSLVLTSDPGSSYLWSNGETTQSISAKITGSYSVRVSNADGCFSLPSDPVDIRVNENPEKPVITGDVQYCTGDSALLSGPPASIYLWSTGDATSSIYVQSGTYTLVVADANGCFSPISDPFAVTENPPASKPVINGDSVYCEGSYSTLTSTEASSYLWSTGATTRSIEATSGTYSVMVTDANGCSSLSSELYAVSESPKPGRPVITPAGPIELDPGDSVTLVSSAAATYAWSPGGETTSSITVMTSGNHTVTVGDNKGCNSDASDAVIVTLVSLEKPGITVTGETAFCEGGSALLSALEADSHLWSTGETTRQITVSETGSYIVTIFNAFGAQSPPSDPVDIAVYENPSLSLVSKSDAICNGEASGSIQVEATGGTAPYTYTWDHGQTGDNLSNVPAGDYHVNVSDANGCQDALGTSIGEPTALLMEETITHPTCGDSYDGVVELNVTGGTPDYTMEWSDGNMGPVTEVLGPGTVSVLVTDANLCQANDTYTLVAENEVCIMVYEIITPNNDGHNDTWEINGIEFYPAATVEVFDRWGRRVYYSNGYPQPWDGTHDGKVLPMDSYHYIINLKNGTDPIIGNITVVK